MIHNIRFRIFVYKDENEDGLIQGLLNILPSAKIEKEEADGIFDDDIIILTGLVDKKRFTKEFFNSLLYNINKDTNIITINNIFIITLLFFNKFIIVKIILISLKFKTTTSHLFR